MRIAQLDIIHRVETGLEDCGARRIQCRLHAGTPRQGGGGFGQRPLQGRRDPALFGAEIGIARRQRQTIRFALGGDTVNARGDVEIGGEPADDRKLLIVLLAEIGVVGAGLIEQLGDHRRDAGDMAEPAVRYSALEIEHRKVQGRDVEFRTVSVGTIEVRAAAEGQPMRFRGYAAVFDSPSEPLPFIETIRPGAFKRSLQAGREVRMFVNHNTDMVLGSTRSGTVSVSEDSRGLLVEGEFPDTTYARDLSALMQRGDVHGMSFGFSVPRGGDVWAENGAQRTLTEIILHEVSVVTGFPAYPGTSGATIRTVEKENDNTAAATVPVSVSRRMNDLYARKA